MLSQVWFSTNQVKKCSARNSVDPNGCVVIMYLVLVSVWSQEKKKKNHFFQNWNIWCLFIFFMKLGATSVFHTTWSRTGVLAYCATAFLVGQWNPTPQFIGLVIRWLCKLHTARLMLWLAHCMGLLVGFVVVFCVDVALYHASEQSRPLALLRKLGFRYCYIVPFCLIMWDCRKMFTFQSCQCK